MPAQGAPKENRAAPKGTELNFDNGVERLRRGPSTANREVLAVILAQRFVSLTQLGV